MLLHNYVVYCLDYVSFVLVMYSLPGLVLYRTRPGKEHITSGSVQNQTGKATHHIWFCTEPDRARNTSHLVLYRTRPGKEHITNTKET